MDKSQKRYDMDLNLSSLNGALGKLLTIVLQDPICIKLKGVPFSIRDQRRQCE